jgi:peptide-methionine (S)-S-oxide reductase
MNLQTIVLAGGCFWCVEAIYRDLKGVEHVESGYAGGERPGVTYQDVLTGRTGHAEVVKVSFDPKVISAEDILRIFFTIHDPTTLNRQGNDVGPQYRSAIFYSNDAQKALAEKILAEVEKEKIWPNPIVTTIEPLRNYTRAEEYHQGYFARFEKASEAERAKMNAGYCALVIEPKVRKFREKYAAKLRKGG